MGAVGGMSRDIPGFPMLPSTRRTADAEEDSEGSHNKGAARYNESLIDKAMTFANSSGSTSVSPLSQSPIQANASARDIWGA